MDPFPPRFPPRYKNYNVGIKRGQVNICKEEAKRRHRALATRREWLRHVKMLCCPAAEPSFSDQQEVPAPLTHRVPPVDTLLVAVRKGVVIDLPYFVEQLHHPTERTKVRGIA